MNTNTPAPAHEAVLTDDEIIALEIEVGGTFTLGPVPFARAIESALLSKLRAPVASDEVMDALNWIDDFIARCNRDDRGSCDSVNVLRRALASVPVAGNARPHIMSLDEILAEYRKGCTNTGGEGPENCPDCVRAFVSALEALNVSQASAPVANAMPIRLSTEVLEYLKEGIENATGCDDSDVDHDFANELERLMTGPLYTNPLANYPEVEWAPMVVAPVAGKAQKRDEQLRKAVATFLNAYRGRYGGIYGQIKKQAPLQDEVLGLVFASREAPPSDDAAPQASEAVRPSEDIVRLAREGVRVNKPGSPEHAVCVEMVKLARALKAYPSDALSAQPGAQNEGRGLCLDTQRPAP
ncbi:hypothetical protein [Achromobacter piechaudii]|uniref:hypothetical protein n=1 Tax=Achromobacter piechaudii TaxID=72556 RepID=UPI003DA8DBD5